MTVIHSLRQSLRVKSFQRYLQFILQQAIIPLASYTTGITLLHSHTHSYSLSGRRVLTIILVVYRCDRLRPAFCLYLGRQVRLLRMEPGEAAGILAGGADVPHRRGKPLKIGTLICQDISQVSWVFFVFKTTFRATWKNVRLRAWITTDLSHRGACALLKISWQKEALECGGGGAEAHGEMTCGCGLPSGESPRKLGYICTLSQPWTRRAGVPTVLTFPVMVENAQFFSSSRTLKTY